MHPTLFVDPLNAGLCLVVGLVLLFLYCGGGPLAVRLFASKPASLAACEPEQRDPGLSAYPECDRLKHDLKSTRIRLEATCREREAAREQLASMTSENARASGAAKLMTDSRDRWRDAARQHAQSLIEQQEQVDKIKRELADAEMQLRGQQKVPKPTTSEPISCCYRGYTILLRHYSLNDTWSWRVFDRLAPPSARFGPSGSPLRESANYRDRCAASDAAEAAIRGMPHRGVK